MLEVITYYAETICIIGFGVCMIGLVCYKFELVEANSWEEAIKKMFPALWKQIKRFCVALKKPLKKIYEFFYDGYTNRDIIRKMPDISLILFGDETTELLNRLSNKPYDTPTFIDYQPNINGISWYNIGALGLVRAYKDLAYADRVRMISNILQNYFIETRGRRVALYLKVVSPTRLYFAVALSEDGQAFLEQQEANNQVQVCESMDNVPLEEEIEIFSHTESEEE